MSPTRWKSLTLNLFKNFFFFLISVSWLLSRAERVGCINTVAVRGLLFVNLSGCGFLVTHFLLACRQPGQMVVFVSLYRYTCMCVVVVLNTNMCMSQCLLVICGFSKRINFPLSLYRSNLANPVALVLNTCKILKKATGKYMIALCFS